MVILLFFIALILLGRSIKIYTTPEIGWIKYLHDFSRSVNNPLKMVQNTFENGNLKIIWITDKDNSIYYYKCIYGLKKDSFMSGNIFYFGYDKINNKIIKVTEKEVNEMIIKNKGLKIGSFNR